MFHFFYFYFWFIFILFYVYFYFYFIIYFNNNIIYYLFTHFYIIFNEYNDNFFDFNYDIIYLIICIFKTSIRKKFSDLLKHKYQEIGINLRIDLELILFNQQN